MKIGASVGIELEPASDGVHDAVCAEIYDCGEETHPTYGVRHQGCLVFQVAETQEVDFGEGKEVRRKEVRGYFNAKSGLGAVKGKGTKLRKWIEGWMGRVFDEATLRKYLPRSHGGGGELLDLDEALLGKSCQLVVAQDVGKESQRAYAKLIKIKPPNPDKSKRIKLTDEFPYVPLDDRRSEDDASSSASTSAPSTESDEPSEDDDDIPWKI